MILPENYDTLTDEFLIHNIIPKTANHLQVKDIPALRKNAARSAANGKETGRCGQKVGAPKGSEKS